VSDFGIGAVQRRLQGIGKAHDMPHVRTWRLGQGMCRLIDDKVSAAVRDLPAFSRTGQRLHALHVAAEGSFDQADQPPNLAQRP
jgi:hypothetical protein